MKNIKYLLCLLYFVIYEIPNHRSLKTLPVFALWIMGVVKRLLGARYRERSDLLIIWEILRGGPWTNAPTLPLPVTPSFLMVYVYNVSMFQFLHFVKETLESLWLKFRKQISYDFSKHTLNLFLKGGQLLNSRHTLEEFDEINVEVIMVHLEMSLLAWMSVVFCWHFFQGFCILVYSITFTRNLRKDFKAAHHGH